MTGGKVFAGILGIAVGHMTASNTYNKKIIEQQSIIESLQSINNSVSEQFQMIDAREMARDIKIANAVNEFKYSVIQTAPSHIQKAFEPIAALVPQEHDHNAYKKPVSWNNPK